MKKGVLVAIILFFLLIAGIVFSQDNVDDKVDNEVEDLLNQQDEVSVIVVLEDDYGILDDYYSASELNEADDFEKKMMMIGEQQGKVLNELESADFELKRQFTSLNGLSGNVTLEGLEKLKNDPNVKSIQLNGIKSFVLDDSVPLVNATNTWRLIYNSTNITGKGETVCVIDSGIDYTHPALGECTTNQFLAGNCGKVLAGHDFKNDDTNPIDDQGHGTHVAGIIASENETFRGVAPDAKLVALKVCDDSAGGNCEDADIISAIDWCVDNRTKYNISVISISLGGGLFSTYCDDEPTEVNLKTPIDNAIANNVSVVIAAGNSGSSPGVGSTTGISSPACMRNATAVGSSNKTDGFSGFGNRNSITDLFAPGSSITSLANGGGLATLSGTSMSTPMVAGAFALMHQYFKLTENRNASPAEIQGVLNDTGKQIDDTGGSGLFFSRINIFAAIASLDTTSPIITITNPENNTAKKNISFIVNITSNEILNNATLEINNTNFTMAGSGTKWSINISNLADASYNYKVYGNDSFGNAGTSEIFNITIGNTIPVVANITVNSTDFLNRTNGTLQASFSFIDSDNDIITANETKWYKNSEEVLELANYTAITSNYTKKHQNWTFSVRVFDGLNFSEWANSSNLTIRNSAPAINITIQNITINESGLADINISGNLGAADNDNDTLTFTYSAPLNSSGQWQTSFTDARNYTIAVNVSDGDGGLDTQNLLIEVLDKVNGANDTITGNITDIKTNAQNLELRINNTLFNSSGTILGEQEINFTDGGLTLAVFDFNFTNTTKFNFVNIKINRTKAGNVESLVINGIDLSSQSKTKTLYLNRSDINLNSVCVKDDEIDSIDDFLDSSCTSSGGTELACDGVATSGFTCTLEENLYKITGLSHSGIKQISFTRPSDSGDSGGSSGSSSSSSGGSGGGGGGSGLSYTCNMDWSCSTWSACDGTWETRKCDFVKVAQHTQSQECPSISKAPETAKKCEIKALVSEIKQSEKPESKANESKAVPVTGMAVREGKKGITNIFIGGIIIAFIVISGLVAYITTHAGIKEKAMDFMKKDGKKHKKRNV